MEAKEGVQSKLSGGLSPDKAGNMKRNLMKGKQHCHSLTPSCS